MPDPDDVIKATDPDELSSSEVQDDAPYQAPADEKQAESKTPEKAPEKKLQDDTSGGKAGLSLLGLIAIFILAIYFVKPALEGFIADQKQKEEVSELLSTAEENEENAQNTSTPPKVESTPEVTPPPHYVKLRETLRNNLKLKQGSQVIRFKAVSFSKDRSKLAIDHILEYNEKPPIRVDLILEKDEFDRYRPSQKSIEAAQPYYNLKYLIVYPKDVDIK